MCHQLMHAARRFSNVHTANAAKCRKRSFLYSFHFIFIFGCHGVFFSSYSSAVAVAISFLFTNGVPIQKELVQSNQAFARVYFYH